jgi:exodeoxyribonuclease VII small subunit
MASKQARKFEDELADLESVVEQIDSGELSLEESITAFERGVGLVRTLNQKLDEVDRRVEVLTRTGAGELRTAPYQGDGEPRDETAAGTVDDDDTPF